MIIVKESYSANYCSVIATHDNERGEHWRLKFVVEIDDFDRFSSKVYMLTTSSGWVPFINSDDIPGDDFIWIYHNDNDEGYIKCAKVNIDVLIENTIDLLNNF